VSGHGFRSVLRVRVVAQVLDLSAGGALLKSDQRLAVGSTGRLQVQLGGETFEATVEVSREQPAGNGRAHLVGVALKQVALAQQDVLDEFLRRAGS
jgi:hypothetical protein